jgi:threonyl-tRNA synthetase
LCAHQVRCELDASTDHIKSKISNAEQMKVHPAGAGLVIGNRDLEANAVSVRVHGEGNLGAKPCEGVTADLLTQIRQRRQN